MAVFLDRAHDSALRRGRQRAALGQWWTNQSQWSPLFDLVGNPVPFGLVQSDGHNIYAADNSRVIRYSLDDYTGHFITGLTNAFGVLCQNGWIWATGRTSPGRLYRMAPYASSATQMSAGLGDYPEQLAYDGARIWTANQSGSVSIFDTRGGALQNVTGFFPLRGIVYDGANMWVSQEGNNSQPFLSPRLLKLDANGNVIATVSGAGPGRPVFDGTNIWVPGYDTLSVVRASTATLIATLTGNGLFDAREAAFDGERILVTNRVGTVSLWKAADLTRIGSFIAPTISGQNSYPVSVCSDGTEFFVRGLNDALDANATAWSLLRY